MTDNASSPEQADVLIEQNLLGALILSGDYLPIAMSEIAAEHFFDPLHARIFQTLVDWSEDDDGRTVTPITLASAMRDDPGLAETGGANYLATLAMSAPALPNIRHLASIIRELALRREALQACEDAVEIIRRTSQPVAKALRPVVVTADAASQLSGRSRPASAQAIAVDVMDRAERAYRGEKPPSVTTGLRLFDDHIGGFQGGDFILIPGRPGQMKSALLGGFSLRAAMAGNPTLVFSLEMKSGQWVERNITDIDFDTAIRPIAYQSFRKGNLTQEELERAAIAARTFHGLPLEICDADDLTIQDIASRARAFKVKHPGKLGLIVVDYLQIVTPSGGKERSREQEVAFIARGHKRLAKALDWPVVAGAQLLNKGGDPRAVNKEQIPTLAAIRESGALEMEADIVFAPHRKAFYLRKNRPDVAEDDSEMIQWKADYRACRNHMKGYGLKFRHGAEFEIDLYVDPRSSSVRDQAPRVSLTAADRAADDLLDGLTGH